MQHRRLDKVRSFKNWGFKRPSTDLNIADIDQTGGNAKEAGGKDHSGRKWIANKYKQK